MGTKLRIREVAALAGVSVSTVSRVLAGRSNTSETTRQRVLACAREHGVLAEIAAGPLLFGSVVICAPARAFDLRSDVFYFKVIQGIRSAVATHDTRLTYCAVEEVDADVAAFMGAVNDPVCSAALIIGIDDPHIHDAAVNSGKPCVLINCRDRNMRLDSVSPDHLTIGEYSANYLIEHGHREILSLLCLRRQTMERRLEGIREALAAHNIVFDEARHLLVTGGFGREEARVAVGALLDGRALTDYPTAILCGGDFLALGAREALAERGIAVPAVMSVMSMDGFNLAVLHNVPLTTVHVPCEELGPSAMRLLQQRMAFPDALCHNLLLGGRLVSGQSVRRIGNRKVRGALPAGEFGLY